MTYLMRLNQINFGIITPEKDEHSGLNTYSAKHLCLLMLDLGSYGAICDTLIKFGYHLETSKTSFLFKLVAVINKVLLPVE